MDKNKNPFEAENPLIPDIETIASEMDKPPQQYDLGAFEKFQEQKEEAAAQEEAAKSSTGEPADGNPLDKVFVVSLDVIQSTICGLVSGKGNKDDRFSLSETRKKELIEVSQAAGLGQKYTNMIGGPEVMFWTLFAGSIMPNIQIAASERKAKRTLKADGDKKGTGEQPTAGN